MAAAYVVPAPCALPRVSQLSQRVWRILGLNPSPMTLGGTNTFLVGTGRARALIDSGEGVPEYREALVEALEAARATRADRDPIEISDLLLTHWHGDHTGGVGQVLSLFPHCRVHKAPSVMAHAPLSLPPGAVVHELRDGARIAAEGATLTAVLTPGHTDDHAAFVLDEERALFSGDCVLGYGSSVFACFPDFMRSLHALHALGAERLYPAHGPAITDNCSEYIANYVAHRTKREAQVVAALQAVPPGAGGASLMALVDAVYGDALDAKLRAGAAGNTLHILKKLIAEGRATYEAPPGVDASAILSVAKDYENGCDATRLLGAATDINFRLLAASSA
jgi:ribonuclease/clavin/mitogillin